MGFVRVNGDMRSVRVLNESKMTGKCMGLSCAWVVDVLRGRLNIGREPCLKKGIFLQSLYEFNFKGCTKPESGNARFFKTLTMLDEKYNLAREIKSGKGDCKGVIKKLPDFAGAAGVVACWSYRNAEDLNHPDWHYRSGGHAIGLIKQQDDKGLYLYDSNFGIYQWIEQEGRSLKDDLKRYLIEQKIYGVDVWPNATMKVYKK